MYRTSMLTIDITVPVPGRMMGFSQIILPFQTEVWMMLGIYCSAKLKHYVL